MTDIKWQTRIDPMMAYNGTTHWIWFHKNMVLNLVHNPNKEFYSYSILHTATFLEAKTLTKAKEEALTMFAKVLTGMLTDIDKLKKKENKS